MVLEAKHFDVGYTLIPRESAWKPEISES